MIDRHCWPATLLVGCGFIIVFSIHFLVGWPVSPWLGPSRVGPDMWGATAEAGTIAAGHLHSLYRVGLYDTLPLWPLALAPVMRLAAVLGLKSSPGPLPPVGYLVIPFSLAIGILLAHAGRTLAWDLGVRRGLWSMQAVLLVCVMLPCMAFGHPEDALATALLMYSLRYLRSGRIDAAALTLGLAIASKEWVILVLPVMAVASQPRWRRFAAITLGPPVALGLSALSVDPGPAFQQLLARSAYSHNNGLRYGLTSVLGSRGSRLTRPAEVALMPVVALWLRSHRPERLSLAVVAALLLRPLAEPILFPYYMAPAAGLLVVLLASARPRSPASPTLLLPVGLTLWTQRMDLSGPFWWSVAVLLLAGTLVFAAPGIRCLLPSPQTAGISQGRDSGHASGTITLPLSHG